MSDSTHSTPFYTQLQRRLHWLVIILVALQFLLQGAMREAMASIERQETLGFVEFLVTTIHTWSGIGIAAVMLWRWQLRRRFVPVGAGKLNPGLTKFVRFYHLGLYVVLVLMAATGALHYFMGVSAAEKWHEWGKWLLLVLIGVHIAGALLHIKDGSKVFQRMMRPRGLR